jgi:TrmH family RNA methyltransferase
VEGYLASSFQQLVRVGQPITGEETQSDMARIDRYREDDLGGAIAGTESDHQSIVVLVNQLRGTGQARSHLLKHGPGTGCDFRRKSGDETRQLRVGRCGFMRVQPAIPANSTRETVSVKDKLSAMAAVFDNLRVVLVATRNPLNLGAAARAMSNFGFAHLRVVNPYKTAFREARSAVGASVLLANAKEYLNIADAVTDCSLVVGTTAVRHRDLQHPLRQLEDGGRLIRERLASVRVALLFGSEKVGLSNCDLSHCHWLMRIPTREEHISMNLGQAVAVCLYELVRNPKSARLPTKPLQPATAGEVERITAVLLETLSASGYVNPIASQATEEKLRRLIRRLNPSAPDAEVLLGMLRQIAWKLRQ